MHTICKLRDDGGYGVVFSGNSSEGLLYRSKNLVRAAQVAAFLNGGETPLWVKQVEGYSEYDDCWSKQGEKF